MSNRLSMERSPYLLQHAGNPVDWRPWGPEVFEEARRTDKPVFLSIGYSTCHWCHVMAHESFEDEETARAVNREFLPVKVDREERPDVDAVYMAACVAMNGSGGWPLTALLTPDQKPFWVGTYLPKVQLLYLLREAARLWREDRAGVLSAGEALTAHLRQEAENRTGAPSRELVRRAVGQFTGSYDRQWGGFGPAPKFPTPHNLIFLLRYARLTGEERAREMALCTLDRMYRGGLFDHVGGGFSRYSTDGRWLIPHFEKMLYDNALLALAYPAGHSFAMLAFLEELWPSAELVVAAREAPEELQTFLRETPHPGLTALVKTPENAGALAAAAPFTKDYPIPERGARYYLCRDGACTQPVDRISELEAL